MARREYINRFTCAAEGCRETAIYHYDRRDEQREAWQRRQKTPWRCTRHTNPESVLGPDNLTTSVTLTALPGDNEYIADKLFWYSPDRRGASGFSHGPGFKAFAKDFPEGTQLIVTTRVVTPGAVPTGQEKP